MAEPRAPHRKAVWLRTGLGLLLTLLAVLHVAGALHLAPLDWLEARSYDLRIRSLGAGPPVTPITIVDIDEASLAAEGQWPWPRARVAQLVETLFQDYHVAVLGFDVVFAETDRSSGLNTLRALAAGRLSRNTDFLNTVEEITPGLDGDARLARALSLGPSVLGYYFQQPGRSGTHAAVGRLPAPALKGEALAGLQNSFREASGFGANLPGLQQAAGRAGHFSQFHDADGDGLVRSIPMLIRYQGDYYASLALAVAGAALGDPPLQPGIAEAAGYRNLEWLTLGDRAIPVDAAGFALVPYHGGIGSYPYVSAADVLTARAPQSALAGHIVLLGTSAAGLVDLRNTPVGNAYPGVEVHANMIDAILANQLLQRPAYLIGYEALLLLLSGTLLSALLPRASPGRALLLGLALTVAVTGLGWWGWSSLGLVLPLATALVLIALLFIGNSLYALFVETSVRRRVAALFGQYVPGEVVRVLSADPAHAGMAGEAREMSILFCDVQGFTSLAERLPPTQLTAMMNALFSALTRVIHEHQGTIDKYMGDAVMAFWGAPLDDPLHAPHAVAAALAMQTEAARLRQDYAARGWPELQLGIGVNSGTVVVGNMGSEFRRAYTVLGDAANLAARLEAQTRSYAVPILIGENTRAACPDIPCLPLDRIRVKGKQIPVTIYLPLAAQTPGAAEAQARAETLLQADILDTTARQAALAALRATGLLPAQALHRLEQLAQPPASADGSIRPPC